MQFIHHCLGIGKLYGIKLQATVISGPLVVHHKYSGRKTMGYNVRSIFQNIFLILVTPQFYPSIILGHLEHQHIRCLPHWWEMFVHGLHISFTQRRACVYRNNLLKIGINNQITLFQLKGKRFITPDISPHIRHQKRSSLITIIVTAQIFLGIFRRIGLELYLTERCIAISFSRICTIPNLTFERRYVGCIFVPTHTAHYKQ